MSMRQQRVKAQLTLSNEEILHHQLGKMLKFYNLIKEGRTFKTAENEMKLKDNNTSIFDEAEYVYDEIKPMPINTYQLDNYVIKGEILKTGIRIKVFTDRDFQLGLAPIHTFSLA